MQKGKGRMNQEWSRKNKEIQILLGKKSTYQEGIRKLISFRGELFEQIAQIVNGYPEEAFYQMPFKGANGYHSKTLAYSIWHIFRIEDIVAHDLIKGDCQILFANAYEKSVHSPIITTGNELQGDAIAEFSKELHIDALFSYAEAVMESSNEILSGLTYEDLKRKFSEEDKEKIAGTGCVSKDEEAVWLIDYWCSKDIRGLLKMPFSRHWIMHIEAMQRIKNKLCKIAREGVDPVAYCGFSCNHCFLSQWCGSCRTEYNVCSFATCEPNRQCPNVKCCKEKGLDGCYDCKELEICLKGFYIPGNDGAAAAKAQALYIQKYGKNEFMRMQKRFHERYHFSKTQEILGQDMYEGLKLLEELEQVSDEAL